MNPAAVPASATASGDSGVSQAAKGKALARAKTTRRASDFHEWRKRVKTLWYVLRLLGDADAALKAQVEKTHRLEGLARR
jgi:hypothetical protein